MALHTQSYVNFHSSDRELTKGFERVKKQALHWVFEGYPVGDYYEAALPNRDAFCMRDVSHQCTGGEVLGLSSHNKNMFLKFGQSISPSRDWCGHWEIDRWDRSCPVDYTDDSDFWYNLPANFDVLYACWRMYEWTGDRDYLLHDDLDRFFVNTLEAYVKAWDHDGDGIPDCLPGRSRRGIPTYDESNVARNDYLYGVDLLAVMARAHKAYQQMCLVTGRKEQAAIYGKRGDALLKKLNEEWCDDEKGIAAGMSRDGKLIFPKGDLDENNCWSVGQSLLYWDVLQNRNHICSSLEILARNIYTANIEGISHYPEIQWRYGDRENAMKSLRHMVNPELHRKEYPEASYCTIGAMATGLMGIRPTMTGDTADGRCIRTLSGLADVDWAEMTQIPVLGGLLSVRHEGSEKTLVEWESESPVTWRAAFHGKGSITVDGQPVQSFEIIDPYSEETLTCADVHLVSGQEICAIFHP